MPTILALGFAAAVYPQLLAVVVVILTRPNPKRLLWACYLGAATTTLACSAAVLAAFRGRESIAGSSSRGLGAVTYLVAGAIALFIAVLVATRGRELLGRARTGVHARPAERENTRKSRRTARPRTEKLLERGSIWVGVGVGAILGIPGPFDLLALGRLARSDYGSIVAILAIVAFTLIKFLLIELPILSYVIHPGGTAARVARFAAWMKVRKIDLIAGVIGVIAVVLIGRGISGLS